jgi:hypothetical protein
MRSGFASGVIVIVAGLASFGGHACIGMNSSRQNGLPNCGHMAACAIRGDRNVLACECQFTCCCNTVMAGRAFGSRHDRIGMEIGTGHGLKGSEIGMAIVARV